MITLYTTHCPRCEVLAKKMEMKNLKYNICDDVDLMLEMGFRTAPILKVDDQIMDFTEAVRWINGVKA